MPTSLASWLGQTTTGGGFAGLLGVASALASGQITWQHAVPLVVFSIVALAWPENPNVAQAAQKLATDVAAAEPTIAVDVQTLLSVFKAGIAHQAATTVPVATTPTT